MQCEEVFNIQKVLDIGKGLEGDWDWTWDWTDSAVRGRVFKVLWDHHLHSQEVQTLMNSYSTRCWAFFKGRVKNSQNLKTKVRGILSVWRDRAQQKFSSGSPCMHRWLSLTWSGQEFNCVEILFTSPVSRGLINSRSLAQVAKSQNSLNQNIFLYFSALKFCSSIENLWEDCRPNFWVLYRLENFLQQSRSYSVVTNVIPGSLICDAVAIVKFLCSLSAC